MGGPLPDNPARPPVDPVPAPAPLNYGRARPPVRLRARHAVVAALLVSCAAGSWWFGRQARSQAQAALYERQAAAHVLSAETVVYDDSPERAALLIASGSHAQLPAATGQPVAVLEDPPSYSVLGHSLGRIDPVGALVFLHELSTPSGLRRIVAVRFLPAYLDGKFLPDSGLVAHVFEPGGLVGRPEAVGQSRAAMLVDAAPPQTLSADVLDRQLVAFNGDDAWRPSFGGSFDPYGLVGPAALRWYAGQPDAGDPGHFTLDYEIAGRRGTVDGYLTDDGRHVRMTVRPARPAEPAPANLDAAPAVADVALAIR